MDDEREEFDDRLRDDRLFDLEFEKNKFNKKTNVAETNKPR